MTNEDAIKMLKSKLDGTVDTSYEWCECVRMAIKALEQEPCDVNSEIIDVVIEWLKDKDFIKTNNQEKRAREELVDYMERQPKTDVLDKIRVEIEELRFGQPLRKCVVDECLEIINKYRQEGICDTM